MNNPTALLDMKVQTLFADVVGQPCNRKEVGSMRSLSLGFGEEALGPTTRKRQYRLWEFGTYSADWRIVGDSQVLLAKGSSTSIDILDGKLRALRLGRFVAIQQLSESAVRLNLDCGLAIEFIGKGDDEYLHAFFPGKRYVEFSKLGWKIGRSETRWTTASI